MDHRTARRTATGASRKAAKTRRTEGLGDGEVTAETRRRREGILETERLREERGSFLSPTAAEPAYSAGILRRSSPASERFAILQLMRLRHWTVERTAERLVLHPNTVRQWLKEFDLSPRAPLFTGAAPSTS
jgi:hypothetical protein